MFLLMIFSKKTLSWFDFPTWRSAALAKRNDFFYNNKHENNKEST